MTYISYLFQATTDGEYCGRGLHTYMHTYIQAHTHIHSHTQIFINDRQNSIKVYEINALSCIFTFLFTRWSSCLLI